MKKYGLTLDPKGWFGIVDSEWINHESTALMIIDMQNYDANRNWSFIGARGTGTQISKTHYYYDRIENIVVPAIQRLRTYFSVISYATTGSKAFSHVEYGFMPVLKILYGLVVISAFFPHWSRMAPLQLTRSSQSCSQRTRSNVLSGAQFRMDSEPSAKD